MTLSRYLTGYVLSIALTLGAGGLVFYAPTLPLLTATLVVLALIQFAVQIIFFMHLGQGTQQEGNVIIFALTLVIIVIVVGGTLWIMSNVNAQHPMPEMFQNDIVAPQNQLE
jgi:cytochrome o ubiquinol oxidase operon protein cyoD